MEMWDENCLSAILKDIGRVIKPDQITLLRQRGMFTRVCLNINISKPLHGSFSLKKFGIDKGVPLTYEGLHEICAYCGDDAHKLEHCPTVLKVKPLEVVV